MKQIIGALAIMVVFVLAAALIFDTLNIGPKIPESGILGDTLIAAAGNAQYWVFFTDPSKKVELGKDLEEIINNDRVMEVRFIQGSGRPGHPMKLEQVVWKRGVGFYKIEA